jgi:hypothetical protein
MSFSSQFQGGIVILDACVHFKPRIEGLLAIKRGERVHHLFQGALT